MKKNAIRCNTTDYRFPDLQFRHLGRSNRRPIQQSIYKKPLKGCKEREVDAAVDFFLDEAGMAGE